MSSLKDQLLKLGLVSEKQARQTAHEQRVKKKTQGREGAAAERDQRQRDAETAQQARREADRDRERARQARQDQKALVHQINDVVEGGKVDGRINGNRRFYYESRDGRVPLIELSDQAFDDLVAGRAALAESPRGEVRVITPDAARKVAALDAAWLRVWNG
ncbi:MAG: DUF2058 family protein [Myxococcales bacterium]|nr:DUF2058 family protein [Myxococcales bacterium]MCB9544627.1 DUF2058 family protein [Myxococcales bacterium]